MPTHDRMTGMRSIQWPALVLNTGAKKIRRQLVFHFFDTLFIDFLKKKADHPIGKDTIHESIYDLSKSGLTTQLGKKALLTTFCDL